MRNAPLSEAYEGKAPEYFRVVRSEIAPLLPAQTRRVLEIGCGDGATMGWLRSVREVEYAVGVELVASRAETAKATFDQMIVGAAETAALPNNGEAFDLILALDVLEHTSDPSGVVQKYANLLAKGGAFIISLPNIGNFSVSLPLVFKGKWEYKDWGILDRTHLHFYDEAGARAVFDGSGLIVDSTEYNYNMGFIEAIGVVGRSQALRWYFQKAWRKIVPRHLGVYQFLIRAVRPQ